MVMQPPAFLFVPLDLGDFFSFSSGDFAAKAVFIFVNGSSSEESSEATAEDKNKQIQYILLTETTLTRWKCFT